MPIPNHPDKLQSQSVLTGQDIIAYRRKIGRFPTVPPPKSVIICLENGLPHRMRWRYPYRKVGRFVGDMLILPRTGGRVGVMANFGMGAPTVAGITEELSAWGVQNLVLISMAGALQPDLKDGDIILCDQAIRDEGTSHHYVPAAKYALPSSDLCARLGEALKERAIPFAKGTTWSIDASYRETQAEVQAYQAEGVLTVEMETAALFTVSQVRDRQAAAVYVIGDSLARLVWEPPQQLKAINESFAKVYAAVVDMLKTI